MPSLMPVFGIHPFDGSIKAVDFEARDAMFFEAYGIVRMVAVLLDMIHQERRCCIAQLAMCSRMHYMATCLYDFCVEKWLLLSLPQRMWPYESVLQFLFIIYMFDLPAQMLPALPSSVRPVIMQMYHSRCEVCHGKAYGYARVCEWCVGQSWCGPDVA